MPNKTSKLLSSFSLFKMFTCSSPWRTFPPIPICLKDLKYPYYYFVVLLRELIANYDSTGEYGRVSVELDGLGLIPVGAPATFTIMVAGGDDAELAVSVQGKNGIM